MKRNNKYVLKYIRISFRIRFVKSKCVQALQIPNSFKWLFRKLFPNVLAYLNDVFVRNTQYFLFLFLIFGNEVPKSFIRIIDTVVAISE